MISIEQIPLILITGAIGYILGSIKSFREQKQKVYVELLPTILQMGYNPDSTDEVEFCKALSKLWLYSSKKVAMKMEIAVSILHDHRRGNLTEAFQEAVIAMRQDIQLFSLPKLKPKDVNHLYTRIIGK